MAKKTALERVKGNHAVTNEVRLCYPHLFEPYKAPGDTGEGAYSVTILIPKEDEDTIAALNEAIKNAMNAGVNKVWQGSMPKNVSIPLHDGDEEKDLDKNPEFEGCMYLAARTNYAPKVIDRARNELGEDDIYPGVFAKVSVDFFAYNASGHKGIGAGLQNVLKTRDGDRLGGGGVSIEVDFEDDFEDDDDDLI